MTKRLKDMNPEERIAHRRAMRMDRLLVQIREFQGDSDRLGAVLNKIAELNQSPTAKKTCPHCGLEKLVVKEFGYTTKRGEVVAQPWCRECRNGIAAHPTRYGL